MASKKLEAITVTRGVGVAGKSVSRGTVLKVGADISERDAHYLVAIKKAVEGAQKLAAPAKAEAKKADEQ